MPQIKEYNQRVEVADATQNRKVSADDMGASKYNQVARLGAAVSDLGETIYKKNEQDEIHDAAIKTSEAAAKFKTDLNDRLREGKVNSEEFLQKYDEHMGSLSGNYTTSGAKNYFEKAQSQLRSDFIYSATQAQTEVAGVKAVASFNQTATNLQSGVENDPASFTTLNQVQHDYIDHLVQSGNLDFKTAEKLKADGSKELSIAAIRGWAKLNPHDAKSQIQEGLWDQYLDSDSKKKVYTEIQTSISAARVDAERMESLQKKQKEESQKHTMNSALQKMFEGKLSAKDVVYDKVLDFAQKKQLLDMIEREASEPAKTDPAVERSAFERIYLPDGDPKKITSDAQIHELFINKKISKDTMNFLRKELDGNMTEEGRSVNALKNQVREQAKAALVKTNPMLGIKDAQGEENYARFLLHFDRDFEAGRKAGKSPTTLLDPDSPDYVGKIIKNYTKSPQQIMRGNFQSTGFGSKPADPAKARKENESPAEYLKRMKGDN